MLVMKQIADLLTMTRILLALLLAWLGLSRGPDVLPLTCWLVIVAWTSDVLDGALARRSRVQYHTWLGDHDLEVDMFFSTGVLFYLVAAGYFDLRLAVAYLLVCGLVFWHWGLHRALGMLVQAPVYGWLIWVAVRAAPKSGLLLIVWILGAVIITWPRFPQEVIAGFLIGIREALKKQTNG